MPRDPMDRYYTPPRLADTITRAVVAELGRARVSDVSQIIEPSVGAGAFARAAKKHFDPRADVLGLDLDPEAPGLGDCDGHKVGDWLEQHFLYDPGHLVLGNPPYRDLEAHVRHALACAPLVCFLTRQSFLGSQKRGSLWYERPPRKVWQIIGRPSFTGGRSDRAEYVAILWDSYHTGPTVLDWLGDPASNAASKAWADVA